MRLQSLRTGKKIKNQGPNMDMITEVPITIGPRELVACEIYTDPRESL